MPSASRSQRGSRLLSFRGGLLWASAFLVLPALVGVFVHIAAPRATVATEFFGASSSIVTVLMLGFLAQATAAATLILRVVEPLLDRGGAADSDREERPWNLATALRATLGSRPRGRWLIRAAQAPQQVQREIAAARQSVATRAAPLAAMLAGLAAGAALQFLLAEAVALVAIASSSTDAALSSALGTELLFLLALLVAISLVIAAVRQEGTV